MIDRLFRFLFNPIRSRIIYDLGVSWLSVLIIYFCFFLFNIHYNNYLTFYFFAPLFSSINYLYGIYDKYRFSSLLQKFFLLSFSGLTAFSILYLFQADLPITMLATVFTIMFSSAARFLTNLPHQSLKSHIINSVVSSNQPILVVGGAGYIGSHVIRQLLEKHEKVRLFDKFIYKDESIKDIINNKNLEIISGDISDLYSLTMALRNTKSVIHLAGIVGDPAAGVDAELTRHINIFTTRMLKETVKAFKIPKFIFASSCSVYGSSNNIMDETSKLNPVSLYAQTKIDSEKDLLEDPYDEFHPTILRFATVFGHSERMRFDLVLNLFCAQAYYLGKITVFGGNQFRPFIHVSDIARAISIVLDASENIVNRQIFNVGDNSMNTTISNLAYMVTDVIKKDRRGNMVKVILNNNAQDKRNYNVSFNKINSRLDYQANITFSDGIKEIYRNMKSGMYKHKFSDKLYSNFETTKLMKKEFHSKTFRETHYSVLSRSMNK